MTAMETDSSSCLQARHSGYGVDEVAQVQCAAQAGRTGSDEEDVDFQSLAFAYHFLVSCYRRIQGRPPERPLHHDVSENHCLAGQPVGPRMPDSRSCSRFGRAHRREPILTVQDLHAAGSAGPNPAAGTHQLDPTC